MKFNPESYIIKSSKSTATEEEIKSEVMLYSASLEFARENGGDLTNSILDYIDQALAKDIKYHANKGYHPVVDTKVCMLKGGWYPSIPGWHCDNVPRGQFNQPDLSHLYDRVYHYVSSISTESDLCPTEILKRSLDVDVIRSQVWKSVDKQVREEVNQWAVQRIEREIVLSCHSGQIVRFSRQTLHNCTPAHKDGWRLFFRLSFMATPPRNEIRNQVQVYTDVNQGW